MNAFASILRQGRTVTRLIAANMACSLLIWLALGLRALWGVSDAWALDLFALPAEIGRFATHPWTLATYMVAQANVFQLIFNMLWLAWFGRFLSDTDSDRTILALYAGGGVLGGFFYLTASASGAGGSFLMGSSASILSVMVYTAMRQPSRHVPLLLIGEVRLKWIAVFTVIITLLGGQGISAHCAHIGGAIFPFLLVGLRKLRATPSLPRRRKPKAFRNGRPLRPEPAAETPEQTLDRLLDKVRVSGFDSLSEAEKKTLDSVSKQL